MNNPVIRTEQLTKTYLVPRKPPVQALRGVNLEIQRGEIFALLGTNGAGKSTLMKILLGLVSPSQGSASLCGYPITDSRSRIGIGYLPEQSFLFQSATLLSFLKLSGKLSGMEEPALSKRAELLIEQFGLVERRTSQLKNFSKGMLRLASIAQALMHEPELLFLDEPTDGLDPKARIIIRDLLKEYRDKGKTIFLNSHVLLEVEAIADRVAIMNQGKIVRSGTVAELAPSGNKYVITTRQSIPPHLVQQFPPHTLISSHDTTTIELSTPSALNYVLDILSTAGIEIISSGPIKSSLEDTFLSVVNGDATNE